MIQIKFFLLIFQAGRYSELPEFYGATGSERDALQRADVHVWLLRSFRRLLDEPGRYCRRIDRHYRHHVVRNLERIVNDSQRLHGECDSHCQLCEYNKCGFRHEFFLYIFKFVRRA